MPRPADRIKIRRKDLRGPDELTTLTSQATDWLGGHQGLLIAVAVTVVVVALGAVVFARYRVSQRDAAAAAFQSAHQTFESGKFAEAAASFAALADEHPGTPFGNLARLYRAHALARQPDPAAAAAAYDEYLSHGPASPYLRQEALVGLGHVKEAADDPGEALEAYVHATELDGPYRVEAMLGAARLDEAEGHPEEARTIYAEAAKITSDTELKALLEAKAAGAGAGATPPAEDPVPAASQP